MNILNFVIDKVECIRSDFWFLFVFLFEKRCYLWLELFIFYDIVKNGCYLVLIGYKLGVYGNEEWRILFVMVEKKLVYFMNYF